MIKAVVFDMDGVLIDSEGCYRDRSIEYMDHLGLTYKREDLNALAGGSQKHYHAYMNTLFAGTDLNEEKYDRGYEEYFKDRPVDLNQIMFEGVKETLPYVRELGFRVALASSSKMMYIDEMLDSTNLREYFEVILSGEMFHESKPNPEIYLTMAMKLGLKPEECIAVEDSTYGITAAVKAGYYVIAKEDDRFGYDQSPANIKFNEYKELREILTKIKKGEAD